MDTYAYRIHADVLLAKSKISNAGIDLKKKKHTFIYVASVFEASACGLRMNINVCDAQH